MAGVNISVGRVRVTSAVPAAGAGGVRSIVKQMKVLQRNFQDWIDRIEGATPEAIVAALKPIFDRSQELVPELTGKLKRSGFIEASPEKHSGVIRASIGYARHGVPHYARLVHERLDIRHAKGKSAKFLEIAVNEKIGQFKSILVAEMRKRVGVGSRGRTR